VQQGRADEFFHCAAGFIERARKDAGCIFYEIYQMVDDRCEFYLLEQWQSEEHFNRHLSTGHAKDFESKVREMQSEDLFPFVWEKVV